MRPLFGSSLDYLQAKLSVYSCMRCMTSHKHIRFWCEQEMTHIWRGLAEFKVWC